MQPPDQVKIHEVSQSPFLLCRACGAGMIFGPEIIRGYFLKDLISCRGCGRQFDVWEACIHAINHENTFISEKIFLFAGFKTKTFGFSLSAHKHSKLDFTEYGIPINSLILSINYTPIGQDFIFPAEMTSNNPYLRRTARSVILYGVPLNEADSCKKNIASTLNVTVTFFEPTENDFIKISLARAAIALISNDLGDMVISAVTAVEFSCKRLGSDLKETLSIKEIKSKDKEYLQKIIIGKIANYLSIPPMGEDILNIIGRLWGQRDKMAHEGRLYQPYKWDNAALQFVAALFAVNYCETLRNEAIRKGLIQ